MARYERTRDEARVIAAMSAMPYGGLISRPAVPDGSIPIWYIADYLEAMRDVLEGVAKDATDRDAELRTRRTEDAVIAGLVRRIAQANLERTGR